MNRLTVRQAISELARAGQLVVRQGIGTFVAEPPAHFVVTLGPERSMAAVEHTTRTLEQEGMPAREVFLSSAIEDCAEAREQLRLPRRRLRRVDTQFLVDGEPWSANTYWLADTRFRGITDRLVHDGSVFRACAEHYGTDLRYAWRSFAAAAASPREAELLGVAVGTPVLVREGLNIDSSGTPTVYVTRRLRSDRMRFVLRYEHDPIVE